MLNIQVQTEMENLESVQRDLKNKLLGRIDEVHDDVKQLRQIVDTNLEDIANELMAKNSKVSGGSSIASSERAVSCAGRKPCGSSVMLQIEAAKTPKPIRTVMK